MQSERKERKKPQGFVISFPNCSRFYVKAVQSERKERKKRKVLSFSLPSRSRLYVKAKGFSFSMPSRSLISILYMYIGIKLLPFVLPLPP
ncbi:hypothetical protein MR642_02630 [bacterium]|nr:hypothetical protein [bacterium]